MSSIINIRGPNTRKFIELPQVGRGTGFGVLGYLARATDVDHHNGEKDLARVIEIADKRRKKEGKENESRSRRYPNFTTRGIVIINTLTAVTGDRRCNPALH